MAQVVADAQAAATPASQNTADSVDPSAVQAPPDQQGDGQQMPTGLPFDPLNPDAPPIDQLPAGQTLP